MKRGCWKPSITSTGSDSLYRTGLCLDWLSRLCQSRQSFRIHVRSRDHTLPIKSHPEKPCFPLLNGGRACGTLQPLLPGQDFKERGKRGWCGEVQYGFESIVTKGLVSRRSMLEWARASRCVLPSVKMDNVSWLCAERVPIGLYT